MNSPQVPISWGELLDKITILQIKIEKLTSKDALKNVEREFKQLQFIFIQCCAETIDAEQLAIDLKKINQRLWDIEDKTKDKERAKSFDDEFIQLARNVYITNDERSRVKRKINGIFRSELVDEKSYADL
jgi:hypothetical protein